MTDEYTTRVVIAGHEVAKAANDHVRALRGLLLSGKICLTGDAATCEMVAHGIDRLEKAVRVYQSTAKGSKDRR